MRFWIGSTSSERAPAAWSGASRSATASASTTAWTACETAARQRQDGRRVHPGQEGDHVVERAVGRVQHEVALAAGRDDALDHRGELGGDGARGAVEPAAARPASPATRARSRSAAARSGAGCLRSRRGRRCRRPRPAAAPARPSRGSGSSRPTGPRRRSTRPPFAGAPSRPARRRAPPRRRSARRPAPPPRARSARTRAARARRPRRRPRRSGLGRRRPRRRAPSAVHAGMSSARAKSTSMSQRRAVCVKGAAVDVDLDARGPCELERRAVQPPLGRQRQAEGPRHGRLVERLRRSSTSR